VPGSNFVCYFFVFSCLVDFLSKILYDFNKNHRTVNKFIKKSLQFFLYIIIIIIILLIIRVIKIKFEI
jgi:hypothetical protein